MDFKEYLNAVETEVKRLGLSKAEVNQLVRSRYQKQWFIQLDETQQLDFLQHLRKEHHDF